MRQTMTGLVATIAVMTMGAAPAMACGYGGCWPCGGAYVSPCANTYLPTYTYAWTYGGCGTCGGWAFERLVEPTTQYYYVNQGPTYTGPGAFAPYPTYQEGGVVGWGGYTRHHWHHGHHYAHHARYGYAPYTYHGRRVLRRYD